MSPTSYQAAPPRKIYFIIQQKYILSIFIFINYTTLFIISLKNSCKFTQISYDTIKMARCYECKIKYLDRQNFCYYCGRPLIKTKFLKTGIKEKDSFYERGIIYQLRGEVLEAEKEFKTLLKINRHDVDAYYQLGKICEKNGQKNKALKLYRRCLAYDKEKKWESEILVRIKKIN